MNFIDFHCHLADAKFQSDIENVISRSVKMGVTRFLQGGVGPEDWERQKTLKKKFPQNIYLGFGLHPYWVSAHAAVECESALLKLDENVWEANCLGELGLDFRDTIVGELGRAHQIEFFEKQLMLVKKHEKVAVFHFVRCHDEAVKILKKVTLPKGGIVHSFNSDFKIAKKYLDLDCGLAFSIGGQLLRENNQALQEAVKKIPLENLLVESDSPDQPPPSRGTSVNEPWTIIEVVERIAQLKNISVEVVYQTIFHTNSLSLGSKKNRILENLHL